MINEVLSRDKSMFLLLTFDYDAESAEIYKRAELVETSYGRYGPKKGLYNILKLLDKYKIVCTFFVPGWVAEQYETTVEEIINYGHEVASHGYLHEKLDLEKNQDEILLKMDGVLSKYLDKNCKGFRAPYWRMDDYTLQLLSKLGYKYDSSLMDDDEPYLLEIGHNKIVELPVDWRLDDWPLLKESNIDPDDFSNRIIQEIMYAADNSKYLCITMHPQLIGKGRNLVALEKIIQFGISINVEFVTCRDLTLRLLKAYCL